MQIYGETLVAAFDDFAACRARCREFSRRTGEQHDFAPSMDECGMLLEKAGLFKSRCRFERTHLARDVRAMRVPGGVL
jgi:hypothetical protein